MAFTRTILLRLIVAAVVVTLASCGNNSSPPPSPTPPVVTSQHLYVSAAPLRASDTGEILQFTLPITGTSTATVNISTKLQSDLAVDINGNIGAGDRLGHLAIFNSPLSNSSTPAAIFNNGTSTGNGQLAFTASGDLFAPDVFSTINLFTHPLLTGITPSQVIVSASLTGVVGATLGSNGDLIVTNRNPSGDSNLAVLQPPYTGVSFVTPFQASTDYIGIALNGTQLFVVDGMGKIDVYNLPVGPGSVPAFSITNGLKIPESVAVDNNGNLYVADGGPNSVMVYKSPLSASSTPSVTLTLPPIPSQTVDGVNVAIGK